MANRSVRACYRAAALRRWALGLAVLLASPEVSARRPRTAQVTPAKGAKAAAPADLSRGGERKGGIEFALGSITAALAAVLVGRGTWELVVAERTERDCRDGVSDDPTCTLDRKPGRGGRVAGGLSIAFALPVAVASGFLFRYAVRTRRDYREFWRERAAQRPVALTPWLGRGGGGASLRLRF